MPRTPGAADATSTCALNEASGMCETQAPGVMCCAEGAHVYRPAEQCFGESIIRCYVPLPSLACSQTAANMCATRAVDAGVEILISSGGWSSEFTEENGLTLASDGLICDGAWEAIQARVPCTNE